MNTTDLKKTPYNPREISPEALEGLGTSMKEFGDLSNITFNRKLKSLVAGHQRIRSLNERYGSLPIKMMDGALGGEEYGFIETPDGKVHPVRFVDWDEPKHKAALVAANAHTIQGEWTDDVDALLEEIEKESPDIYAMLMFEELESTPAGGGAGDESLKPKKVYLDKAFDLMYVFCAVPADKIEVAQQLVNVCQQNGVKYAQSAN